MKHFRHIVYFLIMAFAINLIHTPLMADAPANAPSDQAARRPVGGNIPPEASDELFVVNEGGDLDQYLFRDDVPNGILEFELPITRYYFNGDDTNVAFDSDGLLTASALQHVKDNHILPETVKLRLSVFDVDEDATGGCPEVDYLFINDQPLFINGGRAKLTGANDTWSTPSFEIPIQYLKFPQAQGTANNPPPPAANKIGIQIDVLGCTSTSGEPAWAVEVDWGAFEIPGPIRPILFAHGWTSDTHAFDIFEGWLQRDGIPSAGQVDLFRGIQLIAQTSPALRQAISRATVEFGVDQVNVFAHSKGGLVTRHALRSTETAELVEHAFTFGSPHHGSSLAIETFLRIACWSRFSDEQQRQACVNAGLEFSIPNMRNGFNYTGCTWSWLPPRWENCRPAYIRQRDVTYISMATIDDEAVAPQKSATYPWDADARPMPYTMNVNEDFNWLTHSGLIRNAEVYNCAIHYLDESRANCISLFQNNIEAGGNNEAENVVLQQGGTLNAQEATTLNATLDTVTTAVFEVHSDNALTFSLRDPDNTVIDESVAATDPNITYTVDNSEGWFIYQYTIQNPAAGAWQNVLQAGEMDLIFALQNAAASPYELTQQMAQPTYQPGSVVTVAASLLHDQTPVTTPFTMNGQVIQPDDSVVPLTFVDNGTGGDQTANDGVYTAQFTASAVSGIAAVTANAVYGDIHRTTESHVKIAPATAQFTAVSTDTGTDTNSNGLYDYLDVNVTINVTTGGHFDLLGTLVDSKGDFITQAYYTTYQTGIPLSAGVHTLPLRFDGREIYQAGADGPYTLTHVTIFDTNSFMFQVDLDENVYTTAAYEATQFERALVALAATGEQPIDLDTNGRYDILEISLDLAIVYGGSYEVNGRLVDANNREIAWAAASVYATDNSINTITLQYPGSTIGTQQADGPYRLQDLSIFSTSNAVSIIIPQAHTTQPYTFTQFENGFYRLFLPHITNDTAGQTTGDAYEPDDTPETAKVIPLNSSQVRSITPIGDVDWAIFSVNTLSDIIVETTGVTGDTRLWLLDASLNAVEFDDDDGVGLFSHISRTCGVDPLAPGTYYIAVDEFGNNSEIASYTLSLTAAACP